jgi:hypothetical protein
MNLLDLFRRSRLTPGNPNGNRPPTTYQDTTVEMRNVRFPPTISPGANYDTYTRFEEAATVAGNREPVEVTYYMVTETNDFLMTEDDNNLITGTDIV